MHVSGNFDQTISFCNELRTWYTKGLTLMIKAHSAPFWSVTTTALGVTIFEATLAALLHKFAFVKIKTTSANDSSNPPLLLPKELDMFSVGSAFKQPPKIQIWQFIVFINHLIVRKLQLTSPLFDRVSWSNTTRMLRGLRTTGAVLTSWHTKLKNTV